MSQYRTGTVQVTQGSASVVGTGTSWATEAAAGDLFSLQESGVPYIVGAVVDNTHLTLTSVYAGTSASGQSYLLSTSFTPGGGLPYPEQGDIDTPTVLKRAFVMLDRTVDAFRQLNVAGSPNSVTLDDTYAGTRMLQLVGAAGAGVAITLPASDPAWWLIKNSCGQAVTFLTAASPAGTSALMPADAALYLVFSDGDNVSILKDYSTDGDLVSLAALAASANAVIIGSSGSPTEWTTLSGASLRSALGLAIGSDVQAYAARLGLLAALAPGDSYFMVGSGSPAEWAAVSPAQALTAMGAAPYNAQIAALAALTAADDAVVFYGLGSPPGFGTLRGAAALARLIPPVDNGVLIGSGSPQTWTAMNGAQLRAAIGLAINSDVQQYSENLGALAALSPQDWKLLVGSGSPTGWGLSSISEMLDRIGSTRGSILYRGASGWAILAPGTSGHVLSSNGSGADPSYAAPSSGPSAATQAEQEAASSTSVYVSPGRQQYHPSAAKVWGRIAGNGGAISASYNIASITDSGTGVLGITIDTDFSSVNWAGFGAADNSTAQLDIAVSSHAVGSVELTAYNNSTTLGDPGHYAFVGFGDQ